MASVEWASERMTRHTGASSMSGSGRPAWVSPECVSDVRTSSAKRVGHSGLSYHAGHENQLANVGETLHKADAGDTFLRREDAQLVNRE